MPNDSISHISSSGLGNLPVYADVGDGFSSSTIGGTKAMRNRLYDIISTVQTSIPLTIAPRIPRGAQDYEGYIVLIDMVSGTGERVADKLRAETLQWRIRLYSPALGIGFDSVREDNMYDLRDLIIDKLEDYAFLQHPVTQQVMKNIDGMRITSERFTTPVEFGNVDRALWECTVAVQIMRVTC